MASAKKPSKKDDGNVTPIPQRDYGPGEFAATLCPEVTFLAFPEGASNSVDVVGSMMAANGAIDVMLDKIHDKIILEEVVKKLPDYNANVTVEQIFAVQTMRVNVPDPRVDDCYLADTDAFEPVS